MKNIFMMLLATMAISTGYAQTSKKEIKTNMNNTKMKVEVWSDIMCPFCYIGKRHFEAAMKNFEGAENVELVWHSFQLDPDIPKKVEGKDVYQYLADRKGISYGESKKMHERVVDMAKQAGLTYNYDKAHIANSFDAHRLIQLAKTKGLSNEIEEQLFKAYFTDGRDFGDRAVLTELGMAIGLEKEDIEHALASDEIAYMVKQDIQEAENIGVTGVPFFVFNRKYAVSGAQPVPAFLQTLQKSYEEWQKQNPQSRLEVVEGDACKPGEDCK